jgi:hypothetical protein
MPRSVHGEGVVSIGVERRGRRGEDPRTQTERKEDLMLKEFRDFVLRGNSSSLRSRSCSAWPSARSSSRSWFNLVMPVIAMIIGKPDFSDLTFTINDAVFRYGVHH